jgi:hypothetical protein
VLASHYKDEELCLTVGNLNAPTSIYTFFRTKSVGGGLKRQATPDSADSFYGSGGGGQLKHHASFVLWNGCSWGFSKQEICELMVITGVALFQLLLIRTNPVAIFPWLLNA